MSASVDADAEDPAPALESKVNQNSLRGIIVGGKCGGCFIAS